MVNTAIVVLLAAAVALSVVDLVSGPFRLRALINRRAVLLWLIAGLRRWDGASPPNSIGSRFKEFLSPWDALEKQVHIVKGGMSGHLKKAAENELKDLSSSDNVQDLEQQLLRVATGGSLSACYRLEADQLAAQINAAAETVLDKPGTYQVLLAGFAGLTSKDVEPSLQEQSGPLSRSAYLFRTTSLGGEKGDADLLLQARHELTLQIQRRLDDLQINTKSYQDIASQCGFVIVGIAVSFALVPANQTLDVTFTRGVLGGFVAPLLRSLVRVSSR